MIRKTSLALLVLAWPVLAFAGLGSELVTNGTFDSDTSWTKAGSTTISGGTANFNTTTAWMTTIQQNVSISASSTYLLVFTIDSVTSGAVVPYVGGAAGTVRSAPGTYAETITAGGTTAVGFQAQNSGAVMVVDDVSLKLVTTPNPIQTLIDDQVFKFQVVCCDTEDTGIYVPAGVTGTKIYNTVICGCTVGIEHWEDVEIKNVIFEDCGTDILSAVGTATTATNYASADGDPLFVTPGSDYRLSASSPAINAGTDICSTLGGDQNDLAGVQVCDTGVATGPWTNGVEIGAYGFTATGGGGIIGGGLIPGMFGMSGGGGGAASSPVYLAWGSDILYWGSDALHWGTE